MSKNDSFLIKDNIVRARDLLLRVTDILDRNQVIYHLEGGTLLGIVRDGDLLPWEHDLDISIPAHQLDRFIRCASELSSLKWILRSRYRFSKKHDAWGDNAYRLFKIKNRKFIFFSGRFCFDIFVKYEFENYVYWEAKEKLMRVEKKFYQSYEEIEYFGKKLKVPNSYKEYLSVKYGDWSIKVKEWDCSRDELTIINS